MTRAKMVLFAIILLAVAFLSGLLIGYMEVRGTREELTRLRMEHQLGEIRDLTALMYVETTRQNYGLAADYAGRYFDRVSRASQSDLPEELQTSISELLQNRDAVTAVLAKGDPAALMQIQALYLDTYRRTHTPSMEASSQVPER